MVGANQALVWVTLLVALWSVAPNDGLSQERYPGVSGGSPVSPPAPRRIGTALTITWLGFSVLPDGRSQFFAQCNRVCSAEIRSTTSRIELLFRGARLHLSNSRRPLDTRFFPTPVIQARLEPRGRDVVLVMDLRAAALPELSISEVGGQHYVHATFPAQ